MCWWEVKEGSVFLHLDVRCGGDGVLLKGRTLKAAEILMKYYESENAFSAAQISWGA